MPKNLMIIIASTRPGRIGARVGNWFQDHARTHPEFNVRVADLQAINLPLLDEPKQPLSGQYLHEHTKAWSRQVKAADAFAVVTPEYDYFAPASLVNAVDYLYYEWNYKPVGFVGYGGFGAVRAIQTEKLLFTAVNAMPIPYSVNFTGTHSRNPESFAPDSSHEQAADRMLRELARWSDALSPLARENAASRV